MEKPIIGDEKFWDTTKGTKSFNWKRYGIALNEYIDHLESELKKKDKYISQLAADNYNNSCNLEIASQRIAHLESTLYSEKAFKLVQQRQYILGSVGEPYKDLTDRYNPGDE